MSADMTSTELFKRHCVNLGFLTYDDQGAETGLYVTDFKVREIETFERLIHAIWSPLRCRME